MYQKRIGEEREELKKIPRINIVGQNSRKAVESGITEINKRDRFHFYPPRFPTVESAVAAETAEFAPEMVVAAVKALAVPEADVDDDDVLLAVVAAFGKGYQRCLKPRMATSQRGSQLKKSGC